MCTHFFFSFDQQYAFFFLQYHQFYLHGFVWHWVWFDISERPRWRRPSRFLLLRVDFKGKGGKFVSAAKLESVAAATPRPPPSDGDNVDSMCRKCVALVGIQWSFPPALMRWCVSRATGHEAHVPFLCLCRFVQPSKIVFQTVDNQAGVLGSEPQCQARRRSLPG